MKITITIKQTAPTVPKTMYFTLLRSLASVIWSASTWNSNLYSLHIIRDQGYELLNYNKIIEVLYAGNFLEIWAILDSVPTILDIIS